MVLEVLYRASTYVVPPQYYPHAAVTSLALVVTYAFAQGKATNRERDLHARTILVTGAFTPLGLTLITELASRGAHIIALSPYPLDHSHPSLLIPLLRSTTNNESIYAEYADLTSPESIRAFCTGFLTGNEQRLDAIVYAHEYHGIGTLFKSKVSAEKQRDASSLATFLLTTLLLPSLLVAPIERDIRIITVVNPWYAAAIPSFSKRLAAAFEEEETNRRKRSRDPLFLAEGERSLRTAVWSRHLQRILDALPNQRADAAGKPDPKAAPPPPNPAFQHSNIVSVSVCPGISRADTIAPLLQADNSSGADGWSLKGFLLYMMLYPILWLLTKSPKAAIQTVLHALFLPTPFKRAQATIAASLNPSPSTEPTTTTEEQKKKNVSDWEEDRTPEEVLKPGALYRECSIVRINVPPLPEDFVEKREKMQKEEQEKRKKSKLAEDAVTLEDDGEFGGEVVGRTVWEWYELKLKEWEAEEKRHKEKERKDEKETPQTASTESTPS
ncbi:hypothetical protein K474DRAFT_1647473 [Panus rudis PR-1116 ss-1]|nr:hypothetical protein K474DRAFT_1647473 [Panus rudis PR-1116 ss-1]